MRTESVREEVQRLIRHRPFRPFVLNLEHGDRVRIGHHENIAFDSGDNGAPASDDFYVVSGRVRIHSVFEAVTSVGSAESMEPLV